MSRADYAGMKVGIEVHQQIATKTKLFCDCPPLKSEELPGSFERRLRPAQSELGRLDPAAVFEYSKGKSNLYLWSPESSCLVEADEEPPHPPSSEAMDAAILVAMTLRSKVVDEVHVMRKIVIDGSNTSGFQRTAVVGLGGAMKVEGVRVGVQSVTVEEDAARILGEDEKSRRFALDRLGVPLVEIALDPVEGTPEFVGRVALHLGRILRSTGRVARGLGTIRQDLNVSMKGGKVVEVKGVQKLNLIPKVVEYEAKRQLGMGEVANKLRAKGVKKPRARATDVSKVLAGTTSKVIGAQLTQRGTVLCVVAEGMKGLLGWEPYPGVRFGKELAEVARANSLGGVIHSDEFGRQGVTQEEEAALRAASKAGPDDGLVLLAGPQQAVERCVPLLQERIAAAVEGVQAETRAATEDGETKFMRPRPGSQRMYPETDVPDMTVTEDRRSRLARALPEPWEATVERLTSSLSLSRDMALKLYDSGMTEEFTELCGRLRLEPSLIASVLVDLPPRLSREGVPEEALTTERLVESLDAVDRGLIAKEAVPEVLKAVGSGKLSVKEAAESMGIRRIDESDVRKVVMGVVARNAALVRERGEGSFSPLMGEVMRELRGKADGGLVGRVLREAIQRELKKD